MKKYLLLFFALGLITSCSKNSIGFKQFYNDHKNDSKLALSIPKWATMPFIDKEDRKLIKELSKGMKSVRVLIDEDAELNSSFVDYTEAHDYSQYWYVKDSGDEIQMFTRSEDENLREIVLSIGTDSGAAVIAILGKSNYTEFMKRINPYLKETR